MIVTLSSSTKFGFSIKKFSFQSNPTLVFAEKFFTQIALTPLVPKTFII